MTDSGPAATSTAPTDAVTDLPARAGLATRVRRRVVWALVVAIGVAALAAMALSTSAPDQVLDPDEAGPQGGRVLVQVLRDHGVEVEVVRSVDELLDVDPGPGTTVVVGNPAHLGSDSTELLGEATSEADRLVLVAPTAEQLATLDLPLTSSDLGAQVTVTAGCRSTVARPDDTASVVDTRFVPVNRGGGPAATLCFALPNPRGDDEAAPADFGFGAALATVPAGAEHPEVVAVGVGSGLTNRFVGEESHAGLAVRALGHSPRLVWYQPGIGDLASAGGAGLSAWPDWLTPAAVILGTAVVVLAFVRGRRMGALVTEPLPVVVRAVETTESRGRIYRRARDRGRAAAVLRLGSTERLARRLALPPHAVEAVQAAAAAAAGMPPTQVAALLAGPPPTTDVELHTLANALADLEERVRTS
ncbi:DUF4350 domain-containing protein [Phycicoccus sp. Soil802]|uniref:DUF4350 domain-containing protein n=1 Tax=Phycicoccus sp. Soil802 TaxID=1736414 RepID=UPI000702A3E3|nr:DUF4350 domain-containing protein [Phycicoccus sp. Soil802]KRF27254.1 hypothetical protein ASG91_12295 [Phycicoccus sp. Soil802]